MTRIDKLLNKFLSNPESVKYSDIERILLHLGFEKIQGKGSHIKFYQPTLKITFTFSIHNNECKKYYKKASARTLRRIIR